MSGYPCIKDIYKIFLRAPRKTQDFQLTLGFHSIIRFFLIITLLILSHIALARAI
ncbi:hypothetical protein [Arsenophonus sp. ENCA]|uniref:hypothetical protein n=1 Tax=Arsenophonus sp. ENCA TaxID=1987579 RepID=UPI0025B83780|nr:hypothetical protein [Arsenophonus sp. ENCA]